MTRVRTALGPASLGLLMSLTACAERPRGDAGGPAEQPDPPTATLPADGGALVLQIAATGGYTTPQRLAARLPVVSVYADGRVMTEGPVPLVHPGSAWPDVRVRQLERAEVQELADRSLAAGVAETTDLGAPQLADATTTRFTLTTAEGTVVREAYALLEAAGDPSLSAEQASARERLTGLVASTGGLAAGSAAYEPAAVAAVVEPYRPDPQVSRSDRPWPGPALPGEAVAPGTGCVVATGADAAALADAARAADTLTPWTTPDGARWSVVFRPLLPHESGCADLAG